MALNSTTGDASAQSYLSVAEADAYFATRLNSELWTALETSAKEAALATATRRLDIERYGSVKTTNAQALQWPRIGLSDMNGYPISSLTIPKNLQYATCEVVYALLDEQMLSNRELEMFSDWNVGSISVKIKDGSGTQLPVEARQFLSAIGESVWSQPSKSGKQVFTSLVR